jgi:hypothetical protein
MNICNIISSAFLFLAAIESACRDNYKMAICFLLWSITSAVLSFAK